MWHYLFSSRGATMWHYLLSSRGYHHVALFVEFLVVPSCGIICLVLGGAIMWHYLFSSRGCHHAALFV
jgi:hypothetical protein